MRAKLVNEDLNSEKYYVVESKVKVNEGAPTVKSIEYILKQLGFKTASKEQTSGAFKTWFEHTGNHISIDDISRNLTSMGIKNKVDEDPNWAKPYIYGENFKIEYMGKSLFFVRYKQNRSGEEYMMGLDQ